MMPSARVAARVAALAAVCAVIAAGTAAAATVKVGGPAAVAATSTAQGFLGIATELNTITTLAGPAADPDAPFVQLLSNLSPGAPSLLRLGGNSGDNCQWAIPGMKPAPYLYCTLTPGWASDVRALLTSLGGKAILGVTLKVGADINTRIASAEVADFDRYVGAKLIDAFELGNEPEFYPLSVVNGQRGIDTIADYGKKFSAVASALGGAPLAGPSSGSTHWLPKLGTVLRDMRSRLKLVTVHAYPLKDCSELARNSVSDFFTPASIQGLAASIHVAVRAAAARGKPLRVDEINGIPCGGEAGLSNSFGEALWALNVLPALWQAGVQGVNFQTVDGNLNQMITAKHSGSGSAWSVSVQPEYYGLLAFAEAAPAGSHLLRISDPGVAHFYQFAVRAPDRSERVVLTNVGSVARTIGVSASGTHGIGSVSLLSARSLSATGGATLGGRRLSSRTGQLTGASRVTLVRPNARGVYAVRVPAHAAAILTLSA